MLPSTSKRLKPFLSVFIAISIYTTSYNAVLASDFSINKDSQIQTTSADQGPARGKRLVRPEDILKDSKNDMILHGIKVRKGTIGAYMQNAQVFSSLTSTADEKAAARKLLEEYAPDIIALEFDQGIRWKNPEIGDIIEKARKEFGSKKAANHKAENRKAENHKSANHKEVIDSKLLEKSSSTEDAKAAEKKYSTGEHKTAKPTDILNDKDSYVMINGIKARKGTIAAFSINARTFSAPLSAEEKEAARKLLVELAPGVAAFNVDKVVFFVNPEVQKILENGRTQIYD